MNYKRPVILIAVILIATAFWMDAANWMQSDTRFDQWTNVLVPAALLTLTASAMALSFLLVSRGLWALSIIASVLGAFLVAFGFGTLFLAGAAVAAVCWWWASHIISRELVERRTIRVSSILSHGLPKILLGFYILTSFAFYATPASQNITREEASDAFQEQVEKTSDVILQGELEKLPPGQRAQVKRQISSQAVTTFSGLLNFQFCVSDTVCTPSVLELLPPLYAFLFFVTIWGFGLIFREVGVLLGSGLFIVLKGARFLDVSQEDTKADILKL